jgi:hypothetical protein
MPPLPRVPSLLAESATMRVAGVGLFVALLWLAVAWAVAIP